MENKKDIYNYLKNVKKSLGYIPKSCIVNAYNIGFNYDFTRYEKNVKFCTNIVYDLIKTKSIVKFS